MRGLLNREVRDGYNAPLCECVFPVNSSKPTNHKNEVNKISKSKKNTQKKEDAPKPDLTPIIESLATQVERPTPEVQAEIQSLITEGYSPMGAVATWKSKNKQFLGTRHDYKGRVLGKSTIRSVKVGKGRSSRVTDVDMIVENEDSTISGMSATLWGDRVELADEFELGKPYSFRAKERNGKLTHITSITEIDDDQMVKFIELPERNIPFCKPGNVLDFVDKQDLFHGWVGKLIPDKATGATIGFELSDAESFPVTVWCGEKFGPLPSELKATRNSLAEGDEILVYGYVSLSKTQGDPRINARGIFILNPKK